MKIILFAGFKQSGKTTALTSLARYLIAHGKKVGSIKRAGKGDIEMSRKDSWLHLQSGANPVALFSRDIILIHERASKNSLEQIMLYFKKKKLDYLLVEGFYGEFTMKSGVVTVVCAKDEKELEELLNLHRDASVITGRYASSGVKEYHGIPVLSLYSQIDRIAKVISER
ncbi:MAG: molybdopterin-guanine dinucleotide biosynthesis protein MobB [Conexivisphaerales archaeon]